MSKLKSMLSHYLLKLESDDCAYASLARQFVYFVESNDFLSTGFSEDSLVRLAHIENTPYLTIDGVGAPRQLRLTPM